MDALKQGIAPAIIVGLYLIITKLIDSKKEASQIKLSNEITKSINIISNFIIDFTKDVVEKDKEKCKKAIENSMHASCMRIIHFVTNTIIHNHVDTNKENILHNIENLATTEFYNIYSALSLYKINQIEVSDYLDKEWMTEIKTTIKDVIYNTDMTKEDKIIAFSNKIHFDFQSYISYVTNHAIR